MATASLSNVVRGAGLGRFNYPCGGPNALLSLMPAESRSNHSCLTICHSERIVKYRLLDVERTYSSRENLFDDMTSL